MGLLVMQSGLGAIRMAVGIVVDGAAGIVVGGVATYLHISVCGAKTCIDRWDMRGIALGTLARPLEDFGVGRVALFAASSAYAALTWRKA